MKAIAIVELPNDAFDDEAWGDGKWIIDDEGSIRYKEDDAWMHYKDIDVDGIELRPMPKRMSEVTPNTDWEQSATIYSQGLHDGWNMCLEETLGENNESNINN